MANNDDPLVAPCDQIASREAAPAAEPTDSAPQPRSVTPATVGGIPIASAILLPADHRHADSAWNQHIPFAFWLVQAHTPSIFVELGTFRGTSYFSFCQAVAALRLPTRCFAVDTWEGDSHTGFYDDSVFAIVNACNELKYAGFSHLVRSSFVEALPHFLDGSIDLLHIDGLHTYEACRHDFESWLPKLSRRAIVLFHDTNVRERDFGVHRLWAELIERYPHFEFAHEHGLGVLGVGEVFDRPVRDLFAAAGDQTLTCEIRAAFWRLASTVRAEIDLQASGEERARLETRLSGALGEHEIEVSCLTAESARLRLALEEKERQAAELMAQRAAVRSENAELGMGLAEARSEKAQLDTALVAAHREKAQLDTALVAAHREKAQLDTALAAARSGNAELSAALATVRQESADRQAALDKKATGLAAARIWAEQAEAAAAAARKELDALRRSTSWRITRPLRQLAVTFRFALHTARTFNRVRWTKLLGASLYQHFVLPANIKLITAAGLLDSDWYVEQYPDVRAAGVNPLVHYLRHGAAEGRDPNPLFDSDWYLAQNPDVGAAGVNPLVHYLRHGAAEGRDPNPLFDSDWYLAQNTDVGAAGVNPLVHYLRHGAAEGRDPNPWFDSDWYLAQNPDVRAAGINPLEHYLRHGAAEGRNPNPLSGANPSLSTATDLNRNPDVRGAVVNPLVHNVAHGCDEEGPTNSTGRRPNRWVEPSSSNIDAWADYTAVRCKIAEIRASARNHFQPKAPPIIRLNNEDPIKFANRIVLPNLRARPLVSIVIPVYDAVTYALECLASVSLNSGEVPFEVIVADDASSDDTGRMLRSVRNIIYFRNDNTLGFGNTCNRAMDHVGGRYVVFLNSDTQVCAGWLEEMLRSFTEETGVGAVGPKLVFPDGRLQEAGALIHRNGTSTLIGLFDNPELPRYNSRREVAYCSAACLMVEASVFNSLGGFDSIFAPAYSEDADLCFRLREIGLRVIYTPRSIVIHHLSVSTNQISSEYKRHLSVRNQQRFCERWQKQIDDLNAVRVIAFYLPQFYPIRENDLNWGKGFTEWRNVTKAAPNFFGHCQPRLPADLGFYDLRRVDVMEEQAELAKKYGIHGFCFYYYWFNGRRVLEMPLERLLETGKPNIPFCIAWANENWTRKWDGQDQHVILAQNHSEKDDSAVIKDISRYFSHPNYVRIGNRPLLVIYRPALFPDIKRTADTWRHWCRAEGIGEIFLAMVGAMEHSISERNPADLGFDAVIEFPPHGMGAPIAVPGPVVNPRFRGIVRDYVDTAMEYAAKRLPGHLLFRGVMPGWDNTPRNQDKPDIFANASPGSYQAWLETAMQDVREMTFGDEQCVFVNAWNEWAEGAFLEPDTRFGFQYLEATRNAHHAWLMQNISSPD